MSFVAKVRKKKKHVCEECGEPFKHGIGLRKHQRQTGHKGSRIEEEGDDDSESVAAASAAPAEAPSPPPETPISPPPSPEAISEDLAADEEVHPNDSVEPDEDQTVAVNRPLSHSPQTHFQEPSSTPQFPHSRDTSASRMADRKQKISLVKSGLSVVLSAKAKDAGKQLRQSAKSGADIVTEATKLAMALICFLAVPILVYFWWKSQTPHPTLVNDQPAVFSIESGPVAARSTLLRYLDHVGKQEWEEAYLLLSSDWRQDLTLASFKDAFLDIEDVRWAVNDQHLNPSGEADVVVRLAFREGGQPREFLGRFRLVKGAQGWRIDRAQLASDGPA